MLSLAYMYNSWFSLPEIVNVDNVHALTCRSLKITVEQKCDIATRELDELREDQQRKRDEFDRARDYHKVVVDEAEIRLADIKKSCYEFDRDIIRGAVNPVRTI